jgi:drug/metabolite transporter (DMT)-like permease
MKYTLLCVLNVIFLVIGQTLFKIGTKDKVIDSASAVAKAVLSPPILLGLFLYAATTVLWLYVLTKMPLSRAYPIQALAYPIVVALSFFLFKEDITAIRWVGAGVIFVGIVLVAQ